MNFKPAGLMKLVLLAGLLVFPWIPGVRLSLVVNANLAGEFALIAISLVLLTGWVGQISLGQGSFVGIGAFATALVARELEIPFPANLPIVALTTAAVASLLGIVALRIRGLYLAVATLIFAWVADAYLFTSRWLVGVAGASSVQNVVLGRKGTLTSFDLSEKRVFYYVVLALVVAAFFLAQNLRVSKTGRAFLAVRGSEMAAASLGIDVVRYKLLAFALSGGLAGIAGCLIMIDQRSATPVEFQFTTSLFFLSIAVVGGIGSLGGAIAASVLFAGLFEVFFRVPALGGWLEVVSIGLLLLVILIYPGGLGALGPLLWRNIASAGAVRRIARLLTPKRKTTGRIQVAKPRITRRALRFLMRPMSAAGRRFAERSSVARRLPFSRRRLERRSIDFEAIRQVQPGAAEDAATAEFADWRAVELAPYELPSRVNREVILEAEDIVVRFGGLTAVGGVSLSVREHEITGLIGPNGAGKTTLFNAIAGLAQPNNGRVRIYGQDVTDLPVHVRAQMGVGRTFQLIQLFPQLSVFENLLVATHVHNSTGVFSHLFLSGDAVFSEREAKASAKDVVDLLKLHHVADRRVAGLPFGILRQVEIARALVTRAPFLMLDEPASGLDENETDELARLLFFIRAKLGVSILLIEHDVSLVTSVSDYIYVIDQGRLISQGTSQQIQTDPSVVAAYLGQPVNGKSSENSLVAGV